MSAVKPVNKKASLDSNVHRAKTAEDSTKLDKKISRKATEEKSLQPAPYLQTKLNVSTPGDSHEQEADRVADEVVSRSPANNSTSSETVNPGNSQPEKTFGNAQSLQTKISRLPDESINKMESEPASTETESAPTNTTQDENQVSAEVEQQIESLKGQGEKLPDDVRTEMESQFSHDFSSVCIHNDAAADALCKQLSARAFTVGSDIFFASGEYAPNTTEGKRLLAHELTHVVQQGRGVTRKIMREKIGDPSRYNVHTIGDCHGSIIDTQTKYLEISNPLRLPRFKERNSDKYSSGNLRLKSRPRTTQTDQWTREFNSGAEQGVERLITAATAAGGRSTSGQYFFKGINNARFILFGDRATLIRHFTIPFWSGLTGPNRSVGSLRPATFQVDHVKEMQLGGIDEVGNYELLEASANMGAGASLLHETEAKIAEALLALRNDNPDANIPASVDTIKRDYRSSDDSAARGVIFAPAPRYTADVSGEPDFYWSENDIRLGKHFDTVTPLTDIELGRLGEEHGDPNLYASSAGGEPLPPFPAANQEWVSRVRFIRWERLDDPNLLGRLHLQIFKADRANQIGNSDASGNYIEIWNVRKIPGIYAGTVSPRDINEGGFTGSLSRGQNSLRLPGMSPINIDTINFSNDGFTGGGRVLPTVPLIGDANIELAVLPDEIQLRKTFDFGELAVPPPFEISNASLTAFYSDLNGLGLEGRIDFGITRVGEGFLAAEVSTRGGFALSGEFNFDDRIFGEGTNAQVRMGYRDEQWSMGGTITIPAGKVPGIETATINVDYSQASGFHAQGTATLNVPGVESGTIEITQNEEEGFVIGGSFNLAQGRGIRGGQISARVQEKPDGSGYAVSAHGEAQPDIPGINSNLIVDYNDGAFTAEVSADYSRGMLSGQIHAGVTNRTVNEDGTLADTASEDNELVVFGDGQLTIQIAPWLEGTAGVRFAPNGEITVIGRIALPDELEIFARREINRSIFSIAVQAPIFPGIVAEVGGGLSATAGIGPGVIDELALQIEYNPAHEEDTHITGDAHLNIPANAGLRLNVRAGIGLGITGASATGGLDIGGTLGIEGAAEASVHVDWTPATGLDITAELAVHAQPSFTFDIGGYVSVRALGFEVYDNRWEFASYTFGSDYRFGIRLPIHYHEGEPFDISTDDIVFEVPDIDTDQLLSGLIERIA